MLIFLLILFFNLFLLSPRLIATEEIPNIRINARFLECSVMPSCRNQEESVSTSFIKNPNADESGERPEFKGPYVIEKCLRKLYATIEMNNLEEVNGDDDYIVIEDVDDPATNGVLPLLYPVVLKMTRKQPQLVYPLVFQQVVNGGAYEESFYGTNNSEQNCDQSLCGTTKYNGEPMPYSEGFCCSCNRPRKEAITHYFSNPISVKEPELLFHSPSKRSILANNATKKCPPKKPSSACKEKKKGQCKKRPQNFFFEHDKVLVSKNNERLRNLNKQPHNYNHKGQVYLKEEKTRKTRNPETLGSLRKRVDGQRLKRISDLKSSRNHLSRKSRGSCENEKANNLSSTSSVHCLKLSDLWYSVFRVETPIVIHEVGLQAFQKKDDADGRDYWVDLTRGQTIKLGSFYPQASDDLTTISFSYSSQLDPTGKVARDLSPIDVESNVLLIPTHAQPSTKDFPQIEGGPSEFLVVLKNDLSTDGKGCDRIGTLFEGFSRQDRRCERPLGSCLNHQPLDLWLHDMEKRIQGQRGKYFVENFGKVANAVLASSVKIIKKDYLALNFPTPFRSLIEVEIRSDGNALIRNSGNIQIQSITADSSGTDESVIEVLVVNTGLIPGFFRPWLVECNQDLPADCVPEGPQVFIAPLQRYFFRIILSGSLNVASMTCTVEIHNAEGLRIASRAVLVKRTQRCLCAYHCSCSCSENGFACSPLMEEEYSAAGFNDRIHLREILEIEPTTNNSFTSVYLYVAMVVFILLLLGKVKMLLGCFFRRIKMYGIEFLVDHLNPCFQCCCTENDCYQRAFYLLLNWFFFPIYFLVILWVCFYKLRSCCFCCRNKVEQDSQPLLMENVDYDYTYEMEADDEKFVLDSLEMLPPNCKRSQSSHSM